jgi:flagellar biosynthesis protein
MMENVQYATALMYPPGADAPFIAAQGRGELVRRILEIAEENNIPLVRNTDLSNVLTLYEAGDFIPPETYEILAGIFAWLRRME